MALNNPIQNMLTKLDKQIDGLDTWIYRQMTDIVKDEIKRMYKTESLKDAYVKLGSEYKTVEEIGKVLDDAYCKNYEFVRQEKLLANFAKRFEAMRVATISEIFCLIVIECIKNGVDIYYHEVEGLIYVYPHMQEHFNILRNRRRLEGSVA